MQKSWSSKDSTGERTRWKKVTRGSGEGPNAGELAGGRNHTLRNLLKARLSVLLWVTGGNSGMGGEQNPAP